ncbi:MAG TPA: amidohydrolase family protein [Longimicrobiaceae bacterium]|nr:amidohydrolase family protein [Longimicrobiaceae bacterium]
MGKNETLVNGRGLVQARQAGSCRRLRGGVLAFVPLLVIAGCAGESGDAPAAAGAGGQVFTNARIYDGTGTPIIEDGVLVVDEGGRIVAAGAASSVEVPEGAEAVDLGGRFVIPGMINAHAHVENPGGQGRSEAEQLDVYAHYGVTTVLSQGEDPQNALALRGDRESPDLRTARIYASGLIYAPPAYDETSVDSARAHINALAAADVDWVKIRVDSNLGAQQKMTPEVYQTVMATANEHGLPVAVHLVELEDAKGVLQAGAALISHSVRDQAIDQELIGMMTERNICLVPTLTRELSTYTYSERPAFLSDPFFLERSAPEGIDSFPSAQLMTQQTESAGAQYYRAQLPVAEQNLKALSDAGVGIAMGTDSGTRFPGRFQGYLEHLELEMMVDAGLTPEQALRSATGDAARCIGLEGTVGTLQPGAWADFIVLEADPLADILNTRQIQSVWIAGNQVR